MKTGMRVTNGQVSPSVRFASYFWLVFFHVAVGVCSAALPTVGNVLHGDESLRRDVIGRWAAAAAASRHMMAPPPPLLAAEKWRKRRSNMEPKRLQRDTETSSSSSASSSAGVQEVGANDDQRFTPYVSVGVLSNLQNFFDVLRENLDSLEAMSPEDRAALFSELSSSDQDSAHLAQGSGPGSGPSLDLFPPPLGSSTRTSLRAPLLPQATAQRPSSTAAHIHAQRSGRPSSKTRQFVANSEPAFLRTTNLHDPGLLWVGLGRR